MCSVTEEDFISPVDQNVEPCQELDFICKKCNIEGAMIRLQKKHSYCRNCFVSIVSHKFRSTLGKTKLMKYDDKVLCFFHGNQTSIALAHLLKTGFDHKAHKRLRFRTVFVFVDESPLRMQDTNFYELSEMFRVLRSSGFQCYVTKLSSLYKPYFGKNFDDEDVTNYLLQNEDDAKLVSLFRELKSNTSKVELLWRLRYQLYFSAAKSLHCQKVFTPECGTDLSIRLLSNVALGRGSQIPYDVAVCDRKLPDVLLIRPLREITSKEIVFYNVFNELKLSFVNPISFMCESGSSLQGETESFVYKLQEEFPSTVYTIFHTGDKLKTTEKAVDEKICQFCFNTFQASEHETNCQKEKIVVSIEKMDQDFRNCSNCECCQKKDCESDLRAVVREILCCGCQRILNDMKTMEYFPVDTLNEIRLQSHMNMMRKEIEDFLL